MSDEIRFFHNPMSRARIAHFMLEEVGEPYLIEAVDLAASEHKTPKFLAVNPMGKVPAIIHRDVVVTEAAAICAYLADAFPEKGLAPALDDPARGTYLRWLFFGAGCVEPALVDRMFSRPMPDVPGALGYGSYEDTLRALEKALERGPFILGERFSAADVYIGSQVAWGFMSKSLEPRPRFQLYLERVSARPAYARFVAADLELAKRMKEAKDAKEARRVKQAEKTAAKKKSDRPRATASR